MRPVLVAVICAILIANLGISIATLHGVSVQQPIARALASASPQPPTLATMDDLTKFERNPNEETWAPLNGDIVAAGINPEVGQRLTMVLAYHELPPAVFNAVAVDLSTYDMPNTLRWLRGINILARNNRMPGGPAVVVRTARLSWLLLSLRANYGTIGIDLTHADLRVDDPFVGQSMNLSYIDFSNAVLPAGAWHDSNLTSAGFEHVALAGPLTCTNCVFAGRLVPGTAAFVGGKWSLP